MFYRIQTVQDQSKDRSSIFYNKDGTDTQMVVFTQPSL